MLKAYVIVGILTKYASNAHVEVDVVCQSDFQVIMCIFFAKGQNMLRVISGIYKSRKLKEVKTEGTRPTTDKNKEVLFNTLGQYFAGGACLDLFAGSGALGIEAISRGFDSCDFVENNFQAVNTIKANLLSLELKQPIANVYKTDVFAFLGSKDSQYDLIIADPPYQLNRYQDLLDLITSRQLLNKGGIIVLESDNHTDLPQEYRDLVVLKEKVLGSTKFTIYINKGE